MSIGPYSCMPATASHSLGDGPHRIRFTKAPRQADPSPTGAVPSQRNDSRGPIPEDPSRRTHMVGVWPYLSNVFDFGPRARPISWVQSDRVPDPRTTPT